MNATVISRVDARRPEAWKGTIAAGVICMAILCGMMVRHASPLWTGTTVVLRAVPVDPRDLFRGEFVRLSTPASNVVVGAEPDATTGSGPILLRPQGEWWRPWPERHPGLIGSLVYVQLEPYPGAEHRAVSISRLPVDGMLNLRGRIRRNSYPPVLALEFGLEAFYMEEGTALPVENAVREGRKVQMEVAIASDGRARVRNLIVDGVPLPRR